MKVMSLSEFGRRAPEFIGGLLIDDNGEYAGQIESIEYSGGVIIELSWACKYCPGGEWSATELKRVSLSGATMTILDKGQHIQLSMPMIGVYLIYKRSFGVPNQADILARTHHLDLKGKTTFSDLSGTPT